MIIEIMPDTVGCHMNCPHCPIRLKETGENGHHIKPTLQRLQEYIKDLPHHINFMTDHSAHILDMVKIFKVLPANTQIGMMMFEEPNVQSIIATITELGTQGFTRVNIGVNSRDNNLHNHCGWLTSFMDWYWKQNIIQHVMISIDNNTISIPKLAKIHAETKKSDALVYETISNSILPTGIRLLEPELHDDQDAMVYANFCRMKFNNITANISHRIIAPKRANDLQRSYINETTFELKSTTKFLPGNMVLSLMALGIRICHRTSDINNPYLWITYDDLNAIMNESTDIDMVCKKILQTLRQNSLISIPANIYQGNINEETLAYISENRKHL